MSGYARSAFCRNVGIRLGARSGVGRCEFSPLRRDVGLARVQEGRGARGGFEKVGTKRFQSSVASSPITASTTTPTATTTATSQSPPRRPLYIRLPLTLAIGALTFGLGFIMAAAPAYEEATQLYNPPSDEETLTLFTPTTEEIAQIEKFILEHPLTQSLVNDPKFIASRPHLKIPPALRSQNLTGGTLLGTDKISVPPLQFTTTDGTAYVSLQHLGPALCGHPGIVHGGLLATLLDEGLARCCFPALPNKVGVTASLKIDYKKPTLAGQVVVLRAETVKVEGRKAWVKGRLETLADEEKGESPVVLCEGEALFIEPRQAAGLKRVVS